MLDQKDGRRLVKDTTVDKDTTADRDTTALINSSASTEPNTTLEIFPEPQPIITAQSQWGKGVLMGESEVLKYPNILDTAPKLGALLQFDKTYELMEFLVMQQIKVSQRMAEEHIEQQMIELALT
mgnify:CR=1 FL=1